MARGLGEGLGFAVEVVVRRRRERAERCIVDGLAGGVGGLEMREGGVRQWMRRSFSSIHEVALVGLSRKVRGGIRWKEETLSECRRQNRRGYRMR